MTDDRIAGPPDTERTVGGSGRGKPALPGAHSKPAMNGYVGPIDRAAIENDNFRQVLFTGPHMQLVVMSLGPGEDIGKERHPSLDQFFRVEQGEGEVVFHGTEHYRLEDGDAILVPAGTWHNVINTSSSLPLKLYTLYAPPNHARGTVHRTKADAEAGEAATHSSGN